MKKIISEKASYHMIWFGLILMGGSIILFLWKTTIFDTSQSIQADKVGQFGDFVGGVVGSIFSLTGVILFYVALREQRKDFKTNAEILRLQKEELQLQREELIETRKVFEDQSFLMQEQKNDSRFFSLLENHKEMIASFMKGELKFGGGSGFKGRFKNRYTEPVSGYEVLDEIAEGWKYYFEHYSKAFKKRVILNFKLAEYEDCIDIMKKGTIVSLHFRELYNLYLFIQEKLDNDEFYLNTLNVNLTHDERFLFEAVYYNFKAERKSLNYNSKNYFNKESFIDFEKDKLPIIRAKRIDVNGNYNWLHIHSEEPLKKVKLIIYSEISSTKYRVKDVVTLKEKYLTDSLISFESGIIQSNLNVHEFPFYDRDAFRDKKIVFEITIEKNEIDFQFLFNYDFNVNQDSRVSPLLKYELMNTSVSEIDFETYDYLYTGLDSFRTQSKAKKPEQPIENRINTIISKYFKKHRNEENIETTVLGADFISHGIFRENEGKSAINKLLRDLNRKDQLDKIPFAYSEKKGQKNKWHFGRNGKPIAI